MNSLALPLMKGDLLEARLWLPMSARVGRDDRDKLRREKEVSEARE